MIWVQQQILAAETNAHRREERMGVPAEIVATFVTFSYNHDAFKKDIEARQVAKKQADEQKKADESKKAAVLGTTPPPSDAAASSMVPIEKGKAIEIDIESGQPDTSPVMSDDEVEDLDLEEKEEAIHDDMDDSDLFSCTICIGDFEEGETLRRLPCNHVFHTSCIDPWMEQHTTCPNCRRGLCPRRRRVRNQGAHGQSVTVLHLIAEAENRRERAAHPGRQMSSNRIRPTANASSRVNNHTRYPVGSAEAFSIRVRALQDRASPGQREVEMTVATEALPGTPYTSRP